MSSPRTHAYAAVAHLPFLEPISQGIFWIALGVWGLTFIGMCVSARPYSVNSTGNSR